MSEAIFAQGDAARLPLADQSVDLVFGSPPYCDARTYGIGAQRSASSWVSWMAQVTREATRVSRGLVLWVVGSVTRDRCYWPAPEALLAHWVDLGFVCWRPFIWHRFGIPGSGGKQWFRADTEYVLAFKRDNKPIPYADPTHGSRPPKFRPGGAFSHRDKEGRRVNNHGHPTQDVCIHRKADGTKYKPPKLVNPGNLLSTGAAGGGHLGDREAHENEAPFPEKIAAHFLPKFCPPGGTVLDPFGGSGTTAVVAASLGRVGISLDLRASQVELGRRRYERRIKEGRAYATPDDHPQPDRRLPRPSGAQVGL